MAITRARSKKLDTNDQVGKGKTGKMKGRKPIRNKTGAIKKRPLTKKQADAASRKSVRGKKRGKGKSRGEREVYAKTTYYIICQLCGMKVPLNSSGERVHKFRFHRDPRRSVREPLPRVVARNNGGTRAVAKALSRLQRHSPAKAASIGKLIDGLLATGLESDLDGGNAFQTLMLQCNIGLKTFNGKIDQLKSMPGPSTSQ